MKTQRIIEVEEGETFCDERCPFYKLETCSDATILLDLDCTKVDLRTIKVTTHLSSRNLIDELRDILYSRPDKHIEFYDYKNGRTITCHVYHDMLNILIRDLYIKDGEIIVRVTKNRHPIQNWWEDNINVRLFPSDAIMIILKTIKENHL